MEIREKYLFCSIPHVQPFMFQTLYPVTFTPQKVERGQLRNETTIYYHLPLIQLYATSVIETP